MSNRPSLGHGFFLAALTFCFFLVAGYVFDLILLLHRAWMFVDDLALAFAAGLVVFLYEREHSRELAERLRVIRDMNSFVRNELQILYSCLESAEKTRVSTIEHSVERIDWALRELLPGIHHLDDRNEAGHDQPPQEIRRSA